MPRLPLVIGKSYLPLIAAPIRDAAQWNRSHSRIGRNPVTFFRFFLRRVDADQDEDHTADLAGKGEDAASRGVAGGGKVEKLKVGGCGILGWRVRWSSEYGGCHKWGRSWRGRMPWRGRSRWWGKIAWEEDDGPRPTTPLMCASTRETTRQALNRRTPRDLLCRLQTKPVTLVQWAPSLCASGPVHGYIRVLHPHPLTRPAHQHPLSICRPYAIFLHKGC
jgi:hypothetical protein